MAGRKIGRSHVRRRGRSAGDDGERAPHIRYQLEALRIIQAGATYRAVAARVRAAERRYAGEAGDAAKRRLVRSQTAWLLFHAATDKGAAFPTVERRFRELRVRSSGYVPGDMVKYVLFAYHCGRCGRAATGIGLLEGLWTRLERLRGRVSEGYLRPCRGQVREALRQLRKAQ